MGGTLLVSTAKFSRTLPRLLPKLWAFALRVTGSPRDAEELVQQTCMRALERSRQLAPRTDLLCWIYSIACRIWLDELRTSRLRSRANGEWQGGPASETAAHSVGGNPESDAFKQQIVDAVDQLPEPQRIVMLLIAVEGLGYREAADVLDIPVDTVMSRVARAREAIGRVFSEPPEAGIIRVTTRPAPRIR